MPDRAPDPLGPSGMAQVIEHHCDRQDRRKRIGDPFAGDVRRRPVNRLEHAGERPFGVQVSGGCQPHSSLQNGPQVGDDIAEHVGCNDDIEPLGAGDHSHATGVHVLVVALDLRVITPDLGERPHPEVVGEGQHVGLGDQGDLAHKAPPAIRRGETRGTGQPVPVAGPG